MALDILRNCHASSSSRWLMKDSKLVLVTTSEKWNAQDYGLDSQDVLCVSKCDINKELRTRGGAKFVLGDSLSSSSPLPLLSPATCY